MDDIKKFVDDNWAEIQKDICDLVAIESVEDRSSACASAPFGRGAKCALQKICDICLSHGLSCFEAEGYYAVADLKQDAPYSIGIVSHVDVVGCEKSQWYTDPYTLVEKDGCLVGRGVLDDKGPAILSVWAAKYFQDKDIDTNIRLIFGANEETGMQGVRKFIEQRPEPDFVFTPDAEFPVICGEKGTFNATLSSDIPADSRVFDLSAGIAQNSVPATASCIVDGCNLEPSPHIELQPYHDKTYVVARGISGHASMPEGTNNAIAVLFEYLLDNKVFIEEEISWAELVVDICRDIYGKKLGFDYHDDVLGDLTIIAGLLKEDAGKRVLVLDARRPAEVCTKIISDVLSDKAQGCGCEFEVVHAGKVHMIDPESLEVKALNDAYNQVKGSCADPIAIGGGTYAKRFSHAVAFGPVEQNRALPSWAGGIHSSNEAVLIDELKQALIIYILAIQNLLEIYK